MRGLGARTRGISAAGTSTLTFAVNVPQDRLGNAVTPIGGDFGEIYRDADKNRVVVIGMHYETIRTGEKRVTTAELNEVLTAERDLFNPAQSEAYWRDYQNPEYRRALFDVEVYRVAYRTTIPEQGYAVVAADYLVIGNSVENDSFVIKASEQRACLDMLTASERFLASRSLVRSELFLNGWSQGALVSISFQEALEARGAAVSGVSTAATPANTALFAEGFIFNRRPLHACAGPRPQ